MTNRELFQGIGAEPSADTGMMIDLFPETSPECVRRAIKSLIRQDYVKWVYDGIGHLELSLIGIEAYKDKLI